jgi:hypothetical protein
MLFSISNLFQKKENKMRKLVAIAVVIFVGVQVRAETCRIYDENLSESAKDSVRQACLGNAYILDQDIPERSIEELLLGPHSQPPLVQLPAFGLDDIVTCKKDAFISIRGRSPKFFCGRTNDQGRVIGKNGQPLAYEVQPGDFVKKSDFLKIKYFEQGRLLKSNMSEADFEPTFKNFKFRYREVMTEVAATRIAWALGIPSDPTFSVKGVVCDGCSANPFKDEKEKNSGREYLFVKASIERRLEGKEIKAHRGKPYWSWSEMSGVYDGTGDKQLRENIETLLLFGNLIGFHNFVTKQNRLICLDDIKSEDDSRVCAKPVPVMDDMGSTFGNKIGSSFLSNIMAMGVQKENTTSPRGDYAFFAHSSNVVFNKPGCQLRIKAGSIKHISESVRQEFVRRANLNLTREKMKAILKASQFDIVDLNLREFVRRQDPSKYSEKVALSDAVLDKWTDVMMKRLDQIKNDRCN